jgi:hypothetical protein
MKNTFGSWSVRIQEYSSGFAEAKCAAGQARLCDRRLYALLAVCATRFIFLCCGAPLDLYPILNCIQVLTDDIFVFFAKIPR